MEIALGRRRRSPMPRWRTGTRWQLSLNEVSADAAPDTHERGAPAAVLTVGVEPKWENFVCICRLWPASEQHACIRMGWRPGVGGARVERNREGTVEGSVYGPRGFCWPEGASAGVCLGAATAWLLRGYCVATVRLRCAYCALAMRLLKCAICANLVRYA